MKYRLRKNVHILVIALGCLLAPNALPHGGVVQGEDLCLINVGFYQAHFTVFQPLSTRHQQFCEDLPATGDSVFVMEYLHDGLEQLELDFRIIENVTLAGRFATAEDIARITDIESVTVFHQPPRLEPNLLTVIHHFTDPGEFIGIVTAMHPLTGNQYEAIFPFEVGFARNDYTDVAVYITIFVLLAMWIGSIVYRRMARRVSDNE